MFSDASKGHLVGFNFAYFYVNLIKSKYYVNMKDLIDTILQQSEAFEIVKEVQERLKAEQQKRQEFYALIDENTKAEFVNGKIIYHSPVKKEHNDAAGLLHNLLKSYTILHNLGYVGFDKIMVTLPRNDYEPDISFFSIKKSKHFQKGQMHFPAPDLAIEVLSSNEKHDREVKYKDYEIHGVHEYWIIDPIKEIVEQYLLVKGKYELQLKASEGTISSFAVKDFHIPIIAIFNEQENIKTLQKLLQ